MYYIYTYILHNILYYIIYIYYTYINVKLLTEPKREFLRTKKQPVKRGYLIHTLYVYILCIYIYIMYIYIYICIYVYIMYIIYIYYVYI